MADTKISALPASTTPLAGTEVLPIVQGGVTRQVSVANLTAGRAVSVASLTASTGNIVIGTSGQGIDFSATPGTGTSELLADYEEGTYTPTWNGGTITTIVSAFYTKIGRQVTVIVDVILGASASASASEITVPFAALSASNWGSGGVAFNTYGADLYVSFDAATSKINFRPAANDPVLTCAQTATKRFVFTLTYFA